VVPEGSLPHSQELSRYPYPEQDQSNQNHPILSLQDASILILYIHLRLGLPSGLFPYGFPANSPYAFMFSHILAAYPIHLILLDLIILITYLTKSTNHKVHCYAVFSTLPSLHPSSVRISSAPCSRRPSDKSKHQITVLLHETVVFAVLPSCLLSRFRRFRVSCCLHAPFTMVITYNTTCNIIQNTIMLFLFAKA
jgi:hypothetical protein